MIHPVTRGLAYTCAKAKADHGHSLWLIEGLTYAGAKASVNYDLCLWYVESMKV